MDEDPKVGFVLAEALGPALRPPGATSCVTKMWLRTVPEDQGGERERPQSRSKELQDGRKGPGGSTRGNSRFTQFKGTAVDPDWALPGLPTSSCCCHSMAGRGQNHHSHTRSLLPIPAAFLPQSPACTHTLGSQGDTALPGDVSVRSILLLLSLRISNPVPHHWQLTGNHAGPGAREWEFLLLA